MHKKTEALKMALEALEGIHTGNMTPMAEEAWNKAITALREALEDQPSQQEPVAWEYCEEIYAESNPELNDYIRANGIPLYTSPPAQRKPLTDEQIDELSRTMVKGSKSVNWLCRAIEAAHGIKENT